MCRRSCEIQPRQIDLFIKRAGIKEKGAGWLSPTIRVIKKPLKTHSRDFALEDQTLAGFPPPPPTHTHTLTFNSLHTSNKCPECRSARESSHISTR